MTDVTALTDTQIAAEINAHFEASNALESAICKLRVCKRSVTHLVLENADIAIALMELTTERNYRDACVSKRVAA